MADSDVSQEIAALQADFGQLRNDLLALTKSIGELTKRRAEEGVESLKQSGSRAAERVRTAAAEAHVVEHPISSVLIAFTAGMILGKLVERR